MISNLWAKEEGFLETLNSLKLFQLKLQFHYQILTQSKNVPISPLHSKP